MSSPHVAVLCDPAVFSMFTCLIFSLFVFRGKDSAEELQKTLNASETASRLKEQAAAATSFLGDTLSQAQQLGKATMQEFMNTNSSQQDSSSTSRTESSNSTKDAQKESTAGNDQRHTPQPGQGSIADRIRTFTISAVKEMKAAVLPEPPRASALRGASAKAGDIQVSSSSAIAVAPAPEEAAWQRQWREMRDALGGHAFFQRITSGLRDNRVVGAGRDVAESLRERWETSDSPLVHRLQDATDSLFAEGEAASALREIRARDPRFDMVEFLRHLRNDVPLIIRAYLSGDEDIIKEHCSPEMIERLTGIMKAQAAAGLVSDPTLLDSSEVELVDIKMLDSSPVIVTQFTCQQINCTRDLHGNVVEGAPDEVHRVYYYWALQQEATGYVGEDGAHHPPRWQLREMMIRGMHHLL